MLDPRRSSAFEKMGQYGAAHGIEIRHPFMDVRLVEFCLRLPPEQSYHSGWSRVVMRRAMKGIVPEQVRKRIGKTNLSAGLRTVMENDREAMAKRAAEAFRASGLFDSVELEKGVQCKMMDLDAGAFSELCIALSLLSWLKNRDARLPDAI